MSVYERLDALNISLPELTPPVAAFVPFLRSGNLLFFLGAPSAPAAGFAGLDMMTVFLGAYNHAGYSKLRASQVSGVSIRIRLWHRASV